MSGFGALGVGGYAPLDGGFAASSLAARLFSQRTVDFDATALALADGAAISTWTSRVNAGTYAGTQTGTNRPTFSAAGWSDGGPAVAFAQASKQALACDALAALAAAAHAFGTATLHRRSSTVTQMAWGLDVNSASPYAYGDFTVTDGRPEWIAVGGTNYSATTVTFTDSDSLIMWAISGASSSLIINGHIETFNAGTPNFAYNKAMIGGLPFAATGGIHPSTFDGIMRRQVWWNRLPALRDYAALEQMIGATYTRRVRTIVHGDSRALSSGWSGTAYASPTKYMINLNGAEAGWNDWAVAGSTIGDCKARLTTNGLSGYADAGLPIVHHVEPIVNNPYLLKDDGPTCVAKFYDLCDTLRSITPNCYIVVYTAPWRNDWSTSPTYDPAFDYASVIPYFNTALRAGWSSHADTMIDVVATNPTKWENPDSDYFNGSGVHMSTAGNDAWATTVNAALLTASAQAKNSAVWLAS